MYKNAEKSLFSLLSIKIIAAITILAIIASFLMICLDRPSLTFQPDREGLVLFVELFKVPGTFLAMGLAAVSLVATNHRSEQTSLQISRTSKQIEITEQQNKFANYYKHIEEFEKYITATSVPKVLPLEPFAEITRESLEVYILSTRDLHADLFPNAINGTLEVSPQAISDFQMYTIQLAYSILSTRGEQHVWVQGLIDTQNHLKAFQKRFGLRSKGTNVFVNKWDFSTRTKGNFFEFFDEVRQSLLIIHTALKFSQTAFDDSEHKKIMKVDFEKISTGDISYAEFFQVPYLEESY